MSRSVVLLVTLAPLAFAACSALPAGRFTQLDRFDEDPYFLDELLAHPGGRDGTFGPTGDRLFADRLAPAPGLVGRFGLIHDTDALPDLARLTFAVDGEETPATSFEQTWRPSHQETAFRLGPLEVSGRKFITADDVAVSLLSVANPTGEERSLTLRASSPSTPRAAFDPAAFRPLDVSLSTNRAPLSTAPRFDRRLVRGGVPFDPVPPAANAGRTLVAVGGGHPPFLEIPVRREAIRVHVLTVAGPAAAAAAPGTVLATIEVYYRDGRPVVVPLRAGTDVRPGLGVIDLSTNPRRTIAYLRLEAGDAPPEAIPAVAALTLETYVEPPASQALLTERLLFGLPVEQALVAAAFRDGRLVEHARVRDFDTEHHALEATLAVPTGERVELRVAHAFTQQGAGARARAERTFELDDPFETHRLAYHAWFEANCPRLRSGEDSIDAVWWYRWFLVRHDFARPAAGLLPGRCVFAGRHGADLTRLDPRASAAAILETRWLADPELARDLLRAHVATAGADGRFVAARVDARQEPVSHRLAWATDALDTIHPDREFLREVVPSLARDTFASGEKIARANPGSVDPWRVADVLANASSTARLARRIGRDDLADRADELAASLRPLAPDPAPPLDPDLAGAALAEALLPLAPPEIDAHVRAFAARHLERDDPPRVILREESDPRTGVSPGRPDVLRTVWLDLVHRFAGDLDWPTPWSEARGDA